MKTWEMKMQSIKKKGRPRETWDHVIEKKAKKVVIWHDKSFGSG